MRARARITTLLGLALLAPLTACGRFGLVARHPWIEDRTLSLDAEELVLTVGADAIAIDALFHFRAIGPARDRVMTFPIAAPRGPSDGFVVTLEGGTIERLQPTPADPGLLPAGIAAETWEMLVPGAALAAHQGALRVRYRQVGRGDFAYTLRTGAYWRGPIGALEITVRDPEQRVARATFDGAPIPLRDGEYRLRLVDSEPVDGVALSLR